MSSDNKINKIFQDDELKFYAKPILFKREQLLKKKGLFFLKDILHILDIKYVDVKERVYQIRDGGESPWEVIGVRKLWSHWIVRMTVFAPYYRRHFKPPFERISKSWPRRTTIEKAGIFKMSEVCTHLRFPAQIVRYRVRKDPNSKQNIGVWKDPKTGIYLVKMEVFAQWLQSYYRNDPTKFPAAAAGLF